MEIKIGNLIKELEESLTEFNKVCLTLKTTKKEVILAKSAAYGAKQNANNTDEAATRAAMFANKTITKVNLTLENAQKLSIKIADIIKTFQTNIDNKQNNEEEYKNSKKELEETLTEFNKIYLSIKDTNDITRSAVYEANSARGRSQVTSRKAEQALSITNEAISSIISAQEDAQEFKLKIINIIKTLQDNNKNAKEDENINKLNKIWYKLNLNQNKTAESLLGEIVRAAQNLIHRNYCGSESITYFLATKMDVHNAQRIRNKIKCILQNYTFEPNNKPNSIYHHKIVKPIINIIVKFIEDEYEALNNKTNVDSYEYYDRYHDNKE